MNALRRRVDPCSLLRLEGRETRLNGLENLLLGVQLRKRCCAWIWAEIRSVKGQNRADQARIRTFEIWALKVNAISRF